MTACCSESPIQRSFQGRGSAFVRYHRRMHTKRMKGEPWGVVRGQKAGQSGLRGGCMRLAVLCVLTLLPVAGSLAVAQHPVRPVVPAVPVVAAGEWHDVSMAEYRQHLQALSAVVEACAKERDAKACNPALVGGDDRVALSDAANGARREVRYGWLRVLLARAKSRTTVKEKKKAAAMAKRAATNPYALPPPPTTEELLKAAQVRLADDLARADGAVSAEPRHAAQRAAMEQVLAERQFRGLTRTSPMEKLLEKFNNWLNSLFDSAVRFGAHSPWLGSALEWGLVLVVCVLLVWSLLQLERRWRIRLTPESIAPGPRAASARDWQLWLEDARKAAAGGQWREAIHFVYWAAISRLESRRLWPADRARTPREYLALLGKDDPRRAGLAALTGSFERTWYGGRTAGESDYRRAEEVADALIAGSAGPATGWGGAAR